MSDDHLEEQERRNPDRGRREQKNSQRFARLIGMLWFIGMVIPVLIVWGQYHFTGKVDTSARFLLLWMFIQCVWFSIALYRHR